MFISPDTQKSHPWRVTVRRINHPSPPLFEIIGSCGCRAPHDDIRHP